MARWKTVSLGDVVEIFDGPHATPKKTNSGPIFLGISNLVSGRIDLSETEHIAEDDFTRWTRRVTPEPGDVLFSYETRLGEAAIVPDGLRCCLGRRMGLLRIVREKADPRFVLYAYLGPFFQEVIRQRTIHGSTVDRIPLIEMAKFPFVLPALGEQRAMARLLGALDDKIELNHRMNETLEAMAGALFKSWFVDFRQKGEAAIPGGANPIGWRHETLGDHVSLQRGTTYKSAMLGLPGPYLLGLASIERDGGFRRDKLRTYGGECATKIVLRPGDLYVSLKDVTQAGDLLGSVARVPSGIASGRLTQDTVKLSPLRPDLGSSYLYWLLRSPNYRTYCRARAIGTTNLSLSRDDFLSYPVFVPPAEIVGAFTAIERSLCQRADANHQESGTLRALRDLLLPKLLSGDLRVRDAERVVEAVP